MGITSGLFAALKLTARIARFSIRRSDYTLEDCNDWEAGVDKTKTDAKPLIGFLTVVEHPQHGLFGGYLILNLAGRPVEFHCSAPVKANRAQQILYGPTLDSFLYGEQIGATLLGHAKSRPLAICTDREPVLALSELTDLPVALVLPPDELPGGGPTGVQAGGQTVLRLDGPHRKGHRLVSFELGRNRVAIPHSTENGHKQLSERLSPAAGSLDLWEPFTRIREAIEEAQQAAR